MIWRDEEPKRDVDKQLEYARDLEQQIEERRALERERERQEAAWSRLFEPSEHSPAKWWTDGGETTAEAAAPGSGPDGSDPCERRPSLTASTPLYSRFRVTDHDQSRERLRERAQQLEWKRLLDEQVREKQRREQEAAARRRREEEREAADEIRFLREQHLRAQRKFGLDYVPENYVAIPSPPRPPTPASARNTPRPVAYQLPQQHLRRPSDPVSMRFGDRRSISSATMASPLQGRDGSMPPPAPIFPRAGPQLADSNVDHDFRRIMGLVDPPPSSPSPSTSEPPLTREHVASEYRGLLHEIRRERDELRREREELRREKEELRMERALLQLENEKMATLLEKQRRLMDDERTHDTGVAPSPLHANDPSANAGFQFQPQTPMPQAFTRDFATRDPAMRLQRSMESLSFANAIQEHKVAVPSTPLSVADFAVPANRLTPNVLDSPRFQRLTRYQQDDAEEPNPLEQSLVGESEFVALSPPHRSRLGISKPPAITTTASPRPVQSSAMRALKAEATSQELRSSRVIKSRGFMTLTAWMPSSVMMSSA